MILDKKLVLFGKFLKNIKFRLSLRLEPYQIRHRMA